MTMAATLLISRPDSHWLDRRLRYRCQVDRRTRGTISHHGELALVVTPGNHTVWVRIGWTGSTDVPFTVAAGATVRMHVQPRGNLLTGAWRFLTATKYLRLEPMN